MAFLRLTLCLLCLSSISQPIFADDEIPLCTFTGEEEIFAPINGVVAIKDVSAHAFENVYRVCAGNVLLDNLPFAINHTLDKPLIIDNLHITTSAPFAEVLTVQSPVTLRNLKITHSGNLGQTALRIESDNVTIEGATITNFDIGLEALGQGHHLSDVTIIGTDLTVPNTPRGYVGMQLHINDSTVNNPSISHIQTGIRYTAAKNLTIGNGTIEHAATGIHSSPSDLDESGKSHIAIQQFIKTTHPVDMTLGLPDTVQLFRSCGEAQCTDEDSGAQVQLLHGTFADEACSTPSKLTMHLYLQKPSTMQHQAILTHMNECALTSAAESPHICEFQCSLLDESGLGASTNSVIYPIMQLPSGILKPLLEETTLIVDIERETTLGPMIAIPAPITAGIDSAVELNRVDNEPLIHITVPEDTGLSQQVVSNDESENESRNNPTQDTPLSSNADVDSKSSLPVLGGCSLLL